MSQELKNQVEALLFSSGRKMDLKELQLHLGYTPSELLLSVLCELRNDYNNRVGPLMIVEEGDMWKISVREKYVLLTRKINPNTELTRTMMETLAVIAWKQPITQSEVIAIRTNKAYEHIAELEKMGFLIKEKYGRTYILKLTQQFFMYFDLQDAKAARELFSHIKEPEETQKKLEEVRQADNTAEKKAGFSTGGDTMKKELEITDKGTTPEDMNVECANSEEASREKNIEDRHHSNVEDGTEEEELENPDDRENMVDDDEISGDEAGFVQGYENDAEETDTPKKHSQ